MKQTISITIGHTVVASNRSYEQVIEALEAQLGSRADWENIAQEWKMAHASWEQVVQMIEQQLGTSGFTIFDKFRQGDLLTLAGKPTRASQYVIGNPLLAIQMIEQEPEAALYAPLRLAVYENHVGRTFVAYERFTSQLAQYTNPEIASVAQLVEEKLEKLIAEATGGEQQIP